jgi:tRNA-splicing ligase RtcB
MNKKHFVQLGLSPACAAIAVDCLRQAAEAGQAEDAARRIETLLPLLIQSPDVYVADPQFGPLARAVIDGGGAARDGVRPHDQPIAYQQWGDLDDASRDQMSNACRLPIAVAGALMPDAHIGYGLPIGGVLACDGALIPYGVGVDIGCRMKMTITELPVDVLSDNDPRACAALDNALRRGTRFGTGQGWRRPYDHDVMDEDWSVTAITSQMRDTAWRQLGTSGSGNHFVEWGVLTLPAPDLGLEAGRYVALLSHSGSRGAGAQVCNTYSRLARQRLPQELQNDTALRHLGWLSIDSQEGQEYWRAMNLMGNYAAANHDVIHQNVIKLAGGQGLASVENHHNFAWAEQHGGRTLYVHRKGATPAGPGVLGVIPGNMADSAFIVRGNGDPASLNSAAHGAGRRMSRTAALKQFNWKTWREHLARKNVRLLAGGLDEVPGAYKNIHEVMAAQSDLVDVVAEFFPRIVMMCGDGSRPED